MSMYAIALPLTWLVAYSSPQSYARPAVPDGGGGGRWFTGSPADGFDCTVCHAGGEPIPLVIEGLPGGAWLPGETYELSITWDPPDAHTSLLAEFALADGQGVGEVALAPDALLLDDERCAGGPRAASVHVLDDGRSIVALGDCGASRLRLQWTAPDVSLDEAWLFVAGVHADVSDDPSGDGVMLERIRLPGPGTPQSPGCAVTTRSGAAGTLALALLALAFARRGRAGRIALALVLVGVGVGCARVKPYERERLAKPDMQLELDAELGAGRNHAVEYREGSAGGLGGGGGGCGCN